MIGFTHTFIFASVDPIIDSTLQHIHNIVLEIVPMELPMGSSETPSTPLMRECCNVKGEPNDGDDPRNINVI